MLLLLAAAHADPLPARFESADELTLAWSIEEGWWTSTVRSFEEGGSLAAMLVETGTGPFEAEVQWIDQAGVASPWTPLDERWRGGDGQRLLVAEGDWGPAAQVRVSRLPASIGWALENPVYAPWDFDTATPPRPPAVSAALQSIGVISRETWGAQAGGCSSQEDDWYRFAIHHTAGGQTSGGTVQGAVQALQAYALGSGTYCDIPYQFLVGYDGTLWEGRNLAYTSGATGGGNNPGNIAVCFMGCYDGTYCNDGGHADTLAMMASARLLVQTLADEHATVTTTDTLLGHQQWPGNQTACPGDRVLPRLGELRSDAAHYQARLVSTSWSGPVELSLGETWAGVIVLENTGQLAWDTSTILAPLPRDASADLATSDWLSPTRVAAAKEGTVGPGQTGSFVIELAPQATGTTTLSFTLVQEWVTWFADAPIGGQTPEGSWQLEVRVSDEPVDSEPPVDTEAVADDSADPGQDGLTFAPPGPRSQLVGGCSSVALGPWWLALALLIRRRSAAG